MYYLRTRPAVDPIKFTVDKSRIPTTIKTDGAIEKGTGTQENLTNVEEQTLARRMKQCNVTDENGACLDVLIINLTFSGSDRLVI